MPELPRIYVPLEFVTLPELLGTQDVLSVYHRPIENHKIGRVSHKSL